MKKESLCNERVLSNFFLSINYYLFFINLSLSNKFTNVPIVASRSSKYNFASFFSLVIHIAVIQKIWELKWSFWPLELQALYFLHIFLLFLFIWFRNSVVNLWGLTLFLASYKHVVFILFAKSFHVLFIVVKDISITVACMKSLDK